MAQFGRPNTDQLIDNWETHTGATTDLYTTIDEVTADDSDFVRTGFGPTNDVYVVRLSAVTDPNVSTGHTVRFRYRKSDTSANTIDLTVQLRQNYTNESSQGTLIAQQILINIPATWTTGSFTLTAAEADAITDYGNLSLRFVADQV